MLRRSRCGLIFLLNNRGDFTQEADLVCGICGAHGYETAEVRDVRGNGGGRGLFGGPGKRVDGVFPGRPQSFRHQWHYFCPAGHVPDWQPRILLGMVEARSVNAKKTTITYVIVYYYYHV